LLTHKTLHHKPESLHRSNGNDQNVIMLSLKNRFIEIWKNYKLVFNLIFCVALPSLFLSCFTFSITLQYLENQLLKGILLKFLCCHVNDGASKGLTFVGSIF